MLREFEEGGGVYVQYHFISCMVFVNQSLNVVDIVGGLVVGFTLGLSSLRGGYNYHVQECCCSCFILQEGNCFRIVFIFFL